MCLCSCNTGHAKAQVAGRRLLTAQPGLARLCRICGGQSDSETGFFFFSPSSLSPLSVPFHCYTIFTRLGYRQTDTILPRCNNRLPLVPLAGLTMFAMDLTVFFRGVWRNKRKLSLLRPCRFRICLLGRTSGF
jgi:hypothetical protein